MPNLVATPTTMQESFTKETFKHSLMMELSVFLGENSRGWIMLKVLSSKLDSGEEYLETAFLHMDWIVLDWCNWTSARFPFQNCNTF